MKTLLMMAAALTWALSSNAEVIQRVIAEIKQSGVIVASTGEYYKVSPDLGEDSRFQIAQSEKNQSELSLLIDGSIIHEAFYAKFEPDPAALKLAYEAENLAVAADADHPAKPPVVPKKLDE